LRCGVQTVGQTFRLRAYGIKSNQKVLRIGFADRQHSAHGVRRRSHQYNIVGVVLALR